MQMRLNYANVFISSSYTFQENEMQIILLALSQQDAYSPPKHTLTKHTDDFRPRAVFAHCAWL